MKTKKYFKSMILPLLISGMFIQTLAEAQENTQIQPTYSNAAQTNQEAQKAGLAVNNTNPSLQAALDDLTAAQGQLDRSQKSGDQGQMMAAETAMNNAEDMYVGMLSRMSRVSEKDISDMHTAGTTWPDVASELGVHGMTGQMANNNQGGSGGSNMKVKSGQATMQHGSMGTMQMNSGEPGSMVGIQSSEVMSAPARDTASGQAKGHDTGIKTGVQRNGNGGMMSGAADPGSGMGNTSGESHSGGMSHDMGDSGSGRSGSGGHGDGGSDGGGSGGHGGGGSDGGGSGGHGGGGGGRM